jgi:hypothetical protein
MCQKGNCGKEGCCERVVVTKQGLRGQQGPVGPPGPTGAAGAAGATGPQGDPATDLAGSIQGGGFLSIAPDYPAVSGGGWTVPTGGAMAVTQNGTYYIHAIVQVNKPEGNNSKSTIVIDGTPTATVGVEKTSTSEAGVTQAHLPMIDYLTLTAGQYVGVAVQASGGVNSTIDTVQIFIQRIA